MRKITLTKNKTALVDKEDYKNLSSFKWHFNKKNKYGHGYAQRSEYIYLDKYKYTTRTIYMHREVLNIMYGEVDHINGNALDNRKRNLRKVLHSENMLNKKSTKGSSSKFVGVHIHKLTGKWRSQIKVNGKVKSLGLFKTQEDAAKARTTFIEKNSLNYFRKEG